MVERNELNEFIWNLLRGNRSAFEICEIIQEAVSFKKRIPNSFWEDEEKGGFGVLGLFNLSKAEMKVVYEEVIERIIEEINFPVQENKMYADNYLRLFHALTILKVPKNDDRVPVIGKNLMYNIAYDLWALDDSKSKSWVAIDNVAWFASEAVKNDGYMAEYIVPGRRHNFK